MFSTNAESHVHPVFSLQKQSPGRHAPSFKVAEDAVKAPAVRLQKKNNTDSGYHGLSEDDMDVVRVQSSAETNEIIRDAPQSPLNLHVGSFHQSDDRSTTERSFHSAREEMTKTHLLENVPQAVDAANIAEPREETSTEPQPEPMTIDTKAADQDLEEDLVVDESRTPSQGSSPARPLVRKSSLTFAALPAREPLTTKKSLGARTSRTSHLDQSNFLGRFTGGKSLGGTKQSDPAEDEHDMKLGDKPTLVREESDTDAKTKLHNKSSTQRLHERIHLLGKSQTARPTKSIPAAASIQPSYPLLPDTGNQSQKVPKAAENHSNMAQQADDEDEDDWIQPPKAMIQRPARPLLSKSVSADVMEGIRGKQTISDPDFGVQRRERSASRAESPRPYTGKVDDLRTVSDSRAASPGIYSAYDGVKTFEDVGTLQAAHGHRFGTSTTPIGSPSSKRYVDGPLSASKSKLQSIMKTAKGLFSSSAGVSAQAKMDLLPPTEEQSQKPPKGDQLGGNAASKIQDAAEMNVRKTRSSTEKEGRNKQHEASEQQAAQKQYGQVQQPENQKASSKEEIKAPARPINTAQPPTKATRQSPRKTQNQEAPEVPAHAEQTTQSKAPPAPQAQGRPSQIQRPKDPRRPTKPAKEAGPKPKPQPVAIRVGTLSTQRIPLNNATLSSSLQESLPPPQTKQPVVTKKPSLQPSASSSSLKSSVNAAAKPKALLAAERKKEQVCAYSSMLVVVHTDVKIG